MHAVFAEYVMLCSCWRGTGSIRTMQQGHQRPMTWVFYTPEDVVNTVSGEQQHAITHYTAIYLRKTKLLI